MFRFFCHNNKNRPNIVMVTMDMVRVDRMDVAPVFTELRKRGALFSEVIAYAPYTIAAMHAIHSGMYGTKTGVDAYYKALNFDNDNCPTLAEYLSEEGYFTKADLMAKVTLPHKGFQEVLVHDEHKDDLLHRHSQLVADAVSKNRAFFLYLHYSNIHTRIVSEVIRKFGDFDEEYFSNLDKNLKRYDGYVKMAGEYLQGLLSCMDGLSLFKNTLFVVITDHGCGIGEKPGEKAYGIYTYDYTLKTFAFFIYKDIIPAGIEVKTAVRSIDIMPTILDMLKIKAKKGHKPIDGKSLLPLMMGKEEADREAYSETGGLDGPHPSTHSPNVKCIRTKEWKLIYNTTTKTKELYNLIKDEKETKNLTGQFPGVERMLWEKLSLYDKANPD